MIATSADRAAGTLLAAVIIELTIVTAFIHLILGGTVFLLNAIGYAVLAFVYAVATFVPIPSVRRLGWLPSIGLAAYSLVTIVAYLATGPYIALGWIAKGIEVAIVVLIVAAYVGNGGGREAVSPRPVMSNVSKTDDGPTGPAFPQGRALIFVLLAGLGASAVVVLLALGAGLAAGPPTPDPTPAGGAADLTITSRDNAFSSSTIAVPAAEGFTLRLINEDDVPHNIAIYRDSSAGQSVFIGELITASTIDYEIPALAAGTYYFRCDLHPEMSGEITAEP